MAHDPFDYDSGSQSSPIKPRRTPRKKTTMPPAEVTDEELLSRDATTSVTPALAKPTSITSERYVCLVIVFLAQAR